MAPVRFGASYDGPRLTVAQALRQPNFIPERVLKMLDQQFLVDGLLRQGPPADSGAVAYRESQPLFADQDPEIVEEYGEIPVIETSRGALHAVRTVKRGAALVVSREMRDRNDASTLNLRMQQVRNTFTRAYDKLFMQLVLDADIQTFAAGDGGGGAATWLQLNDTTETIRQDLSEALLRISNATPDGAQADNFLGFDADTLVISPELAAKFIVSDSVNSVFIGGDIASENLKYTGKLPRKFFGLDVVKARALTGKNLALVMQRGIAGFISDEVALEGTPMYEHRPTQTWRTDFTRRSVAALDQPKAVLSITGVEDAPTP